MKTAISITLVVMAALAMIGCDSAPTVPQDWGIPGSPTESPQAFGLISMPLGIEHVVFDGQAELEDGSHHDILPSYIEANHLNAAYAELESQLDAWLGTDKDGERQQIKVTLKYTVTVTFKGNEYTKNFECVGRGETKEEAKDEALRKFKEAINAWLKKLGVDPEDLPPIPIEEKMSQSAPLINSLPVCDILAPHDGSATMPTLVTITHPLGISHIDPDIVAYVDGATQPIDFLSFAVLVETLEDGAVFSVDMDPLGTCYHDIIVGARMIGEQTYGYGYLSSCYLSTTGEFHALAPGQPQFDQMLAQAVLDAVGCSWEGSSVRVESTVPMVAMNDIVGQTGYGHENLEDFVLTGLYADDTLDYTTLSAIRMPTSGKDGGDGPKVTLKISGKATMDLALVKASGSVEVEWEDPPSGAEVLETQMEIEAEVLTYCAEVSEALAEYIIESLFTKIKQWIARHPPSTQGWPKWM